MLSFSVFPFLFCFVFSSYRFPCISSVAFVFLVASLLSLVADSVILVFRLGATPLPPPRAVLASLKFAYSPSVLSSFLRACC